MRVGSDHLAGCRRKTAFHIYSTLEIKKKKKLELSEGICTCVCLFELFAPTLKTGGPHTHVSKLIVLFVYSLCMFTETGWFSAYTLHFVLKIALG